MRAAIANRVAVFSVASHRNRSVHPCQLAHRRVRHEVRRIEPVSDEVAVVWQVAELTAVREAARRTVRRASRIELLE